MHGITLMAISQIGETGHLPSGANSEPPKMTTPRTHGAYQALRDKIVPDRTTPTHTRQPHRNRWNWTYYRSADFCGSEQMPPMHLK